jgi:hypothetical protein
MADTLIVNGVRVELPTGATVEQVNDLLAEAGVSALVRAMTPADREYAAAARAAAEKAADKERRRIARVRRAAHAALDEAEGKFGTRPSVGARAVASLSREVVDELRRGLDALDADYGDE